jgi:hypothetical protein
VGEVDGVPVELETEVDELVEAVGVETDSCAVAMFVNRNSATKAAENLFIKNCCFQSCEWL